MSIQFYSSSVGEIQIIHESEVKGSSFESKKRLIYQISQNVNLGLAQRVYQLGVSIIYKLKSFFTFDLSNKLDAQYYAQKSWKIFSSGKITTTTTIFNDFFKNGKYNEFHNPKKIAELLRKNREFALDVLQRSGEYFEIFSAAFGKDKELVKLALKTAPEVLECADFKLIKEIVIEAITKNDMKALRIILRNLPPKLMKDQQVLKSIEDLIQKDAMAYCGLPENLKINENFAKLAYKGNNFVVSYLPDDLKNNRSFMLEIAKESNSQTIHYYMDELVEKFATDKEFLKELVKISASSFRQFKPEFQKDKEFIKDLIAVNKDVYMYISSDLRQDEDINIVAKRWGCF